MEGKSLNVNSSSAYATSRVRLQRVRDGVTFWGWLRSQNTATATIRSDTTLPYAEEDEYVLQVMTGARVMSDRCHLLRVEDREVEVALRGEAKVSAPVTAPRAQVRSLLTTLRVQNREVLAQILDASETGAGLLSPISLHSEDLVRLEVRNGKDLVMVQGKVRYCRPAKEMGQFRVGLQLEAGDKLDTIQWGRVIQSMGEDLRRVA